MSNNKPKKKESIKQGIMEFNFLKEFLNSGITQQDFAKTKSVTSAAIAYKLRKQIRRLLETKVIDCESIVCDTSMGVYDVRRNKENWLKAISAYEERMLSPVEIDDRKITELTVSEFVALCRSLNDL